MAASYFIGLQQRVLAFRCSAGQRKIFSIGRWRREHSWRRRHDASFERQQCRFGGLAASWRRSLRSVQHRQQQSQPHRESKCGRNRRAIDFLDEG